MMTYLYLDIETIPAQSQAAKDRIAATIKPPAQMKKAETIAAWEKEGKEQAVQEAIDKTSFDGGLGHVCCIGWAIGDGDTCTRYTDDIEFAGASWRRCVETARRQGSGASFHGLG